MLAGPVGPFRKRASGRPISPAPIQPNTRIREEGKGHRDSTIQSGDKIEVGCMIATGDWVTQSFMVP